MRVVLDTSAIIYLNDFRKFDEIFTVSDVVREVKDKITTMKLTSLNLKIMDPREEVLREIKNIARDTGDLEKLSETDLKILALAKERNCAVVSDDRNIQNVAEKIGINYVGVFSERIKKLVVWKKFCKNCEKYFESGAVCPVCGSKLVRSVKTSTEIG